MKRLLFSALLFWASALHVCAADEIPFGTYGYRHHEMHALGVIDDLLKKSKKSCCDSGLGGECRVTELSLDGKFYKYGNLWCPISSTTDIRLDVSLPLDVQAIVCARASNLNTCPSVTYCAAARLSG